MEPVYRWIFGRNQFSWNIFEGVRCVVEDIFEDVRCHMLGEKCVDLKSMQENVRKSVTGIAESVDATELSILRGSAQTR